jgi:ASC-1-like (ASCH) protein
MATFEYKTWSKYYQLVKSGDKTFEIRRDDRDTTPKPGDEIVLIETYDGTKEETGDRLTKKVTYVLPYVEFEGLSLGYIAIGFSGVNISNSQNEIITCYVHKNDADIRFTTLTSSPVDLDTGVDSTSNEFLTHVRELFGNYKDSPNGVFKIEVDLVNSTTSLNLLPNVNKY